MGLSHTSSLKSKSTRAIWIKTENQILHLGLSISSYSDFVILHVKLRTDLSYRSQFRGGKCWVFSMEI